MKTHDYTAVAHDSSCDEYAVRYVDTKTRSLSSRGLGSPRRERDPVHRCPYPTRPSMSMSMSMRSALFVEI